MSLGGAVATITERAFGPRLRALRRLRGLSQADLGGDRFSGSYISHIESGRRQAGPDIVSFLADRLGVAPEELGIDAPAPQPKSADRARAELDVLEHMLSAEREWRLREWRAAARAAERAASAAQGVMPERHWEALYLRAQALFADGDYATASQVASDLARHPVAANSDSLRAQALALASSAFRACGQLQSAISYGARAVEASRLAAPAIMSESLMVLIGARAETGETGPQMDALCAALADTTSKLDSKHFRGLVAWALGTAAFQAGRPAQGLEHHTAALELLDPQRDIRMWSRLHKAVASCRLQLGLTDQVADHLEIARSGLRLVGNPSDLAELRVAEARLALLQGDSDTAEAIVRHCLDEAAVLADQNFAADALLLLADIQLATGQRDGASATLRRAAMALEEAGAFRRAVATWRRHSDLQA